MNLQGFLDNFRYVAEAPNGVKQLRELIYFLGITGGLCPQYSADGDGVSLLEEIQKERKARIERGLFKRSPRLETHAGTYDDHRPKIPESWVWTRLVDIGEISPKNVYQDETIGSFASMSAISEMHGIPIQGEDRAWQDMKKGYTHISDGDVVVAKITPCFENGKAAAVTGLTNGFGAGTTELHVVRPLPGVRSEFIYLFLRSSYFKANGIRHMTGTAGQKRLPSEYFATLPFPLPPRAEQQRIVAKVEELMAFCDELEAQQHERKRRFPALSRAAHKRFIETSTIDNLRTIFGDIGGLNEADMRESIIALAVQGQLVPQDPDDIHALKLLRSIPEGRKRERSLPEVTEDEIPYTVPGSWAWERLGNIALRSDSGWSPKCEASPRSGDSWGVLKVSAVSWGKFLPDENKALPSYLTARPEYEVKDGDFLVSRANTAELVARSVVVENPPPRLMMSDKIVRIHISGVMNKKFLNCFHSSRWARDYYAANASGTSGSMKNVSRSVMLHLPVPVPPLNEQRRIIETVQKLLGLVDKVEDLQRRKVKKADDFARSAVAAMTGAPEQEPAQMKVPKTELVTCLQADLKPDPSEKAPLATLLAENDGTLSAKALWQRSGLAIDAFYQQLKTEMAQGWIVEPEPAAMCEVAAD